MDQAGVEVAGLVFQMVQSPHDDLLDEVVTALAGGAIWQPSGDLAGSQLERAQLAAGALFSAHESYQERANRLDPFLGPPSTRESQYKEVERDPDAREAAQFQAALTALALSRVYRTLGDWERQLTWRERSWTPFLASYRVIPRLAESRINVATVVVHREPSEADLADYRRHCDELLAAFHATFAVLGR
jgi:hypothetical protein